LLPFTVSRVGKLAACLILGVAALSQSARSQTPPPPGSFGALVLSDNPVAFWQLNETNDPSAGGVLAYDYTGHGLNATYGVDAFNGCTTNAMGYDNVLSPQPPTYGGFAANQGALQLGGPNSSTSDALSVVTVPPLGLSTNNMNVTIAMWIYPTATPPVQCGLFFNRTASSSDAAGFSFSPTTSTTLGETSLGYTWNNTWGSYHWDSTLYPQIGQWSFVVLVVQTNLATIYLYYLDQNNNNQPVFLTAANGNTQTPEAFTNGATWIGGDPNGNGATRIFPGDISDVAVFNSALTSDQILALFSAGVGVQGYPPEIIGQPQSALVQSSSTKRMTANVIGTEPRSYQWTLNGTDVNLLPDATNFTGATTSNVLTILKVAAQDAGTYQLIVTNAFSTNASGVSVPVLSSNAILSIQAAALVGEWLSGTAASLNDVSGFSIPHNLFTVGANNYVFTNDVPPGQPAQSVYSLFLYDGASGLAVQNTSTNDTTNYDNTFDGMINDAFTVSCWARGLPEPGWNPMVSKWGETEAGWQLRTFGNGLDACFTVRDTGAGSAILGQNGGDMDDMGTTTAFTADGQWHFYVGTFDAASGIRNLYVDAVLAAQEAGNVPYTLATGAHVGIGTKESPTAGVYDTNSGFGNYSVQEIYDVRVYNYALAASTVLQMYGLIAPVVNTQPQSIVCFKNTTGQISAYAAGTPPLAYQWKFNGVNVNSLADATNFTGANSNVLTILSVTTNDVGSYQLTVTGLNSATAVSSNANLSLIKLGLVGEWLNGPANFADVSGYSPTNTHDGYAVGAGIYVFTNDAPAYRNGQALIFPGGNTAIAISNSASGDTHYTNTFDGGISSEMTVSVWAKGTFNLWNGWPAWVSKAGGSAGWELRADQAGQGCWTVRDNGAGTMVMGSNLGWDGNDDLNSGIGIDSKWHLYTGTYSALTGIRNLYIDGVVDGLETGNTAYIMAPATPVTLGAEGTGASSWDQFMQSTMEMYDARIYNYALTSAQVQQLLALPPGTPAQIGQQPPASISTTCEGITVPIGAFVGGSPPMTNQWLFNGVKLVDGTQPDGAIISGSTSIGQTNFPGPCVLVIANVTTNEQGVYTLAVTNAFGGAVSSNATLTVGVLPTAPALAGNLVGAWLTGAQSLADTSGYSPKGTHDASVQSGSTYWTNDVPPTAAPGSYSLYFNNAGLLVSNSCTLDGAHYVNTFDAGIANSFTVMCWAKGYPGGWNPWVCKNGDTYSGTDNGWQLRVDGWDTPCFTIRGTGDMGAPNSSDDSLWHQYTGTYDLPSATRCLYVDGNLVVTWTSETSYALATTSHLMIGAKDNGGNAFGNYFTGGIYGVQIYDTAFSLAQVNSALVSWSTPPSFVGTPAITTGPNGKQLVLTWSIGSLLQATNVAGPWTPTGATSPYTNFLTDQHQFFKVSNP
jgi:hypothetical protein